MTTKTLKQIFDEGSRMIDRPVFRLLGDVTFETMLTLGRVEDRGAFWKEIGDMISPNNEQANAALVDAAQIIEQVVEKNLIYSSVGSVAKRLGHENEEVLARSLTLLAVTKVAGLMMAEPLPEEAVDSVKRYLQIGGLIAQRSLG